MDDNDTKSDAETEVRYFGEYKCWGEDTWYVAGNIYGYENRDDAGQAIETMRAKGRERGPHRPVERARITTTVTTSATRPYMWTR